jgi:hypothetical protein
VKYRAYRKPSRKLRIAKVGKPRSSAFFVASWRVIDDRRSLRKSNPVACNPKTRTKAKKEARDLKNVYESDTKRLTNMRAARGIPPLGL